MRLLIATLKCTRNRLDGQIQLRFVNVFRQFIHLVIVLFNVRIVYMTQNATSALITDSGRLIKTAQWLDLGPSYQICVSQLNFSLKSLSTVIYTRQNLSFVCTHWNCSRQIFFLLTLAPFFGHSVVMFTVFLCQPTICLAWMLNMYTHPHLQWKSIILNICSRLSTPFQCYRCESDCIPCKFIEKFLWFVRVCFPCWILSRGCFFGQLSLSSKTTTFTAYF